MTGNELLKFLYVNWRGDEHEYVIEPEGIRYMEVMEDYSAKESQGHHWILHGHVVTMDGDPRVDMGDNRRRSFIMARMQVIQEIDRSG